MVKGRSETIIGFRGKRVRRGISPYVSVILLTIIVLGVGAFLYNRTLNVVNNYYQRISKEIIELKLGLSQRLGVLASYIDKDNRAVVLVATGPLNIKILSVYVNNTPISGCTLYFSNGSSTSDLLVPTNTIAALICPLSNGARQATIKIVYEGGEVVTFATRI